MLKTEKMELPGGVYELTQVVAHPDGLRLFHAAHKWLGPMLGIVSELAGKAEGAASLAAMSQAISSGGMLPALGAHLGAMMADPGFVQLIEEYWSLGGLRCDGKLVDAKAGHWDAHMGDYYGAVFLALKTNLLPAFQGLAGRLPQLSEQPAQGSASGA